MPSLTLKTIAGKDAGTVELDADMFGVQPNVPVMHQVVTAQLAARRSGTQSTKTRAEVSGGGAKPFRQKGTGNARQGSTRAPHFVGGGVAFGPKPRSYAQKTNKKMIKLALRSALSDRANEGKVVVVDEWKIDAPKTKVAKQAIEALGLDGRILVVLRRDDTAAALSFRNLPNVQVCDVNELNAYDVLCSDWVVFSAATLPSGAAIGDGKAAPAPATAATTATTDNDTNGAAAGSADASADVGPHGAGSHEALEDDSEPEGFPIKGNADSMLYHVPGSRFYKQTKAEVWFATEEAAEAAGFSKPGSQKADEEATS